MAFWNIKRQLFIRSTTISEDAEENKKKKEVQEQKSAIVADCGEDA